MVLADGIRLCGTGVPPVRRRRRLAVWLILLASLALWCGRFAYLRITLRPTPRPDYWEAQLAALDPPPPGAISSSEALAVLEDRPWEPGEGVIRYACAYHRASSVLEGSWDRSGADTAAAIAVFESDAFNRSRARLKGALAAGWRDRLLVAPDPSRRYIGLHYGAWCQWLAAHSRWCIEENSDYDTAVEDWLMILRLGRQVRRARTVSAVGSEGAMTALVAREMACAAGAWRGRTNCVELALKVADAIGQEPPPPELLAGERLHWLSVLEHMYVREGGDWLDVSEVAGVLSRVASMGAGPPSRIWNLTSPVFHSLPAAQARVEEASAAFGEAATLAAVRQAEQWAVASLGSLEGFSAWSPDAWGLPSAAWGLAARYQGRCSLEAALTLMALHEYRVRHGRYPDELGALVPGFLPRLPIDYADRQPLRYRLIDERFVLYSVGSDGKDDGGRCTRALSPWASDNADAVLSDPRRREVWK